MVREIRFAPHDRLAVVNAAVDQSLTGGRISSFHSSRSFEVLRNTNLRPVDNVGRISAVSTDR